MRTLLRPPLSAGLLPVVVVTVFLLLNSLQSVKAASNSLEGWHPKRDIGPLHPCIQDKEQQKGKKLLLGGPAGRRRRRPG